MYNNSLLGQYDLVTSDPYKIGQSDIFLSAQSDLLLLRMVEEIWPIFPSVQVAFHSGTVAIPESIIAVIRIRIFSINRNFVRFYTIKIIVIIIGTRTNPVNHN